MIEVYERQLRSYDGICYDIIKLDQSRFTGAYKLFGKDYWVEYRIDMNIWKRIYRFFGGKVSVNTRWILESEISFKDVEYFNCKNS